MSGELTDTGRLVATASINWLRKNPGKLREYAKAVEAGGDAGFKAGFEYGMEYAMELVRADDDYTRPVTKQQCEDHFGYCWKTIKRWVRHQNITEKFVRIHKDDWCMVE